MAIVDLQNLPENGVLIGIDPGTKTLGIAVSDTTRLIASPLEIIRKGRKLRPALNRLFEICDAKSAVGLVIGLPLNMDGTDGPRVQSARALGYNILELRDIPIAYQDERLSSAEAERAMIEADLSRKRRAELLDASAAAIILQAVLDRA